MNTFSVGQWVLVSVFIVVLTACGGGGSGGSGNSGGGGASQSSQSSVVNSFSSVSSDASSQSSVSSSSSVSSISSSSSSPVGWQASTINAFSVPLIADDRVPHNTLAVDVGPMGQIHAVWRAPSAEQEQLRYGVYNGTGLETQVVTVEATNLHESPDIVVDATGTVHITWLVDRDSEAGIAEGNNAIYYASGGLSGFTVEQVSNNPTDPNQTADRPFLAYVDDRPKVALLEDDTPVVVWVARRTAETDYTEYAIRSTRSGGVWGWVHEELFDVNESYPDGDLRTFDSSRALSVPKSLAQNTRLAWIDISDYQPWMATESAGSWTLQSLDEPLGSFTTDHIQIERAGNGDLHYLWQSEDGAGNEQAVVATDTGAGSIASTRVTIERSVTGNFMPATIDHDTGDAFFIYYEGGFGTIDGRYLIVGGTHYEIPVDEGAACGHRSLLHNAGTLYHVTCDYGDGSGDGQIIVTEIDLQTLAGRSGDGDGGGSGGDGETNSELTSNQAVTGLSASEGESIDYTLEVPAGASNVIADVREGTGDVDLALIDPDGAEVCTSNQSGNEDTCVVGEPASGTWKVRLSAYVDYSGVRLVGYSRVHDGDAGDINGIADLVGVYDWSDEYAGGVIDVWYLAVASDGTITEYDYRGDEYNAGSDCNEIAEIESLTSAGGNYFETETMGRITVELVLNNLVTIPVDTPSDFEIVGEKTNKTQQELDSNGC